MGTVRANDPNMRRNIKREADFMVRDLKIMIIIMNGHKD